MNYNKSFFGLFLALLVVLPGCILHVPSYRRQSLRIMRDSVAYSETEKNVVVRATLLSATDKHDFFGEHIGAIKDGKYKVIYISVNNLSDEDYILAADCIDLKQISSRSVVKSMKKTSSFGRLVLWDMSSIPAAIVASCTKEPLFIAPVSIGFAVIGLISLAQGIKSIVMNTRIRKDIEVKIIPSSVIISSGDHYEGLIFVRPSDYKPQFTVAMHEKNNKKNTVIFDVDLRKVE
jgi:hypothetical protein